jgi:peptidoglycan/xylan/chitin deacetylase (PgdA/CDA1 family)
MTDKYTSWDHADLATLSVDGDTSEMTQLETALLSIIGVFPTYMRPPYFSTNGQVLSTLGSLGYHVVQASIDTLDWQYNTAGTIGNSVSLYQNAVSGGYAGIPLAHDTLPNTVQTLIPAMISTLQAAGLTCKRLTAMYNIADDDGSCSRWGMPRGPPEQLVHYFADWRLNWWKHWCVNRRNLCRQWSLLSFR